MDLLFNLLFAAIVGGVVWFILSAVQRVRDRIALHLRGTDPRKRDELMRDLLTRVRAQADAVKCPRCQGPAFAMLDRDAWWKCEACHREFEGPAHLPAAEGVVASGHPTGG